MAFLVSASDAFGAAGGGGTSALGDLGGLLDHRLDGGRDRFGDLGRSFGGSFRDSRGFNLGFVSHYSFLY